MILINLYHIGKQTEKYYKIVQATMISWGQNCCDKVRKAGKQQISRKCLGKAKKHISSQKGNNKIK